MIKEKKFKNVVINKEVLKIKVGKGILIKELEKDNDIEHKIKKIASEIDDYVQNEVYQSILEKKVI
ncbi:hypothetical protein [Spiroplasma tabanidicola]|uniref:Uncharacterized protein n=1 Tax=Spiroplasma tabanidicola TaxID=324079 RepID=A0A6I6CI98_9MOLU|nr:hypothetical protein [Spiroplasma tabanidicola]QGS51783.1 hypothetical protein STABA_v1c04200 [Spiroplasma tabanidicola]